MSINSPDANLCARNSPLCIKLLTLECGEDKSKGVGILCSVSENGRRRGSVVIEGRSCKAGRVSAEPIFIVAQGEVVVIKTDAAVHQPLVALTRRKGKPGARAEDPVQIVFEHVTLWRDDPVRHLLGEGCPGAEMEIGQARSSEGRIGIAVIVITNAKVDCKAVTHFPCVLSKCAPGCLGVAVVVRLRLSSQRIIGEISLGVRVVINQVNERIKLKIGLSVRSHEECYIVTMPTLVAGFNGVRTNDMGQNVAPVIAVLDVVAQGETHPKAGVDSGNIHDRHSKQAALWCKALDTAISKEGLIECVRREG